MCYKGYKMSSQTRQRMSESHSGKIFTTTHRRNISLALKGRTLAPDTKAILSEIASKRTLSEEHRSNIGDSIRGDKHPNWKGGVTYPISALRKTKEYRHWRNAVLERDGYKCTQCSKSNIRLDAHHKYSFTLVPDLRFVVSNGITLCVKCHTKCEEIER